MDECIRSLRSASDLEAIASTSIVAWQRIRFEGITLFWVPQACVWAAYFNDAKDLWDLSGFYPAMFHVSGSLSSAPRTLIHPDHLTDWLEHLAENYIPVQLMHQDMLDGSIGEDDIYSTIPEEAAA